MHQFLASRAARAALAGAAVAAALGGVVGAVGPATAGPPAVPATGAVVVEVPGADPAEVVLGPATKLVREDDGTVRRIR